MNQTVNVKAILDECRNKGLKGIRVDENGWRAETFYTTESNGGTSLAISKNGEFTCFKSDKHGSIVGLYCDLIGKDRSIGKAELRSKGLLPQTYTEIRHEKPTKSEAEKEREERDGLEKAGELFQKIRFDFDPADCAKWRGIPVSAIRRSVDLAHLGYLDSYPVLGSAYAFICNTPPIKGLSGDIKGIMLRSTLVNAKDKWRNPVNYPIWAPTWNLGARDIIVTEGQWDAIVMQLLLDDFGSDEMKERFQVLALSGPKNINKYPEVMEYLTGKGIYFVPDRDENDKGEKILAETSVRLEQIVKEQFVLRVLKDQKDLNDWYKLGISRDQFDIWMEGADPIRVSNGYVIDSTFRREHKLAYDSLIEVTNEGVPVPIYKRGNEKRLYEDKNYLMELIRPFPILSEYVEECSNCIESPIIYHIICFLTYMAGVCGRRFRFESGSTKCLFPNMFSILSGPSGIGKSEAMKMLMFTVSKVNASLFTSEEFSAEALIDEFKDNPQKMIVTEEMSPWLRAREGSYRYWAMKNFLKMHGCEGYNSDRPYRFTFRKTGMIEINEPCLSLLGACTLHDIQNLNSEYLTDGVVGRFLYPTGSSKHVSIPFPIRIRDETLAKVERFFRAINGTPIRTNVTMRFSRAASEMYEKAFYKQEALIKQIDPNLDANTYSSRWRIQVFKFCILFELQRTIHEFEEDNVRGEIKFKRSDMVVSEESLAASFKLVEMLSQSFYDKLFPQFNGNTTESFASKLQKRIVDYLKKHVGSNGEGVGRTELFRFLNESKREVDGAIDALVEGAVIFQKEIRTKRGRPTTTYLLAEDKNANNITNLIQESTNQNYQRTDSVNGQTHNTISLEGVAKNGHAIPTVLGGLRAES